MTIKKKLIGYGYTDSNGVATLDYDKNGTEISTLAPTGSSGYIGKGVGSVQLEAGLHSSETVVSVPCNVLDCMWYDEGKDGTGKHNDIWTVVEGALTRHDEYTALTNGNGTSHYIRVPVPSLPVKITFDYKAENMGTASAWNWYFSYLNSSNASITGDSLSSFKNTPYTDWVHIEIELTATSITTTGDKTATQTGDYSGVKAFAIIGRNGQIESRFKNFKMYPL